MTDYIIAMHPPSSCTEIEFMYRASYLKQNSKLNTI